VAKDASNNVLNGRTFTFASSNTAVATIDTNTGVATGVAPGTTTITATSEGVVSNNATLTVTAIPVATVEISPTTQSVVAGQTTPAFTAVTKDGGGNVLSGRTITFASSDPTVATVDANTGVATGVAAGTASITAMSEGKTSTAATLTVTPAPVGSVIISPTSQSVVEGGTTPAFTAVTKDGAGHTVTGRVVTFASSNPSVAAINSNSGVATGVSPGSSSITATSEGKTSPAATLTVSAAPVASITISPTTQSVVDGSSTPAFTAVTKDGSGNVLTGRVVTFASSAPSVATINANTGVATGQSPGTTSITASSEGKTSNVATLTVTAVPVANVVVAPSSQAVDVGSTVTFVATPRDAANNPLSGRTIVYSSSDPSIATINSSTGVATGVAPGSVTIGALSEGKTGTASLTVNPVPVATVTVAPSSQSVVAGSTTSSPFVATTKDGGGNVLTGRVITFGSSDNSIATVDNSGNATGVAPGTVTITATSEGKSGTASLTVTPVPVASLGISPALATGTNAGGTIQFTATPRDAGSNALTGRVITWTSSDPSTATIDANGLMTAIADGVVTITAHCEGVDSTATLVTILL
ncbi:MAG: Ig-like domain-containing protein, partial [Gemmatimonadota bacterium]|nr:Ig-like domain-containing protein [Gemmatimonadota bacterium]